jgi:hypothetical protein
MYLYHTLPVHTLQHELYYTGISDCPNTDRQRTITYCTGELRFLRCYAAIGGNSLPTFRDNVSAPSSRVKMGSIGCPETSVRIYHYSPSSSPKERSSHLRTSRRKPVVTCTVAGWCRLNTAPQLKTSRHCALLLQPHGKPLQSLPSIVVAMF